MVASPELGEGDSMRGMLLATALATSGVALAAPVPKGTPQPTLLRTATYSSFEQGGSVRLPLFDPAKGILRGAKVTTSGTATYTLTPGGPVKAATPYAYKVGYYIYYGPHSFHLFLTGSQTLEPFKGPYTLSASGQGAEDVPAANLPLLRGKGSIGLTFSSDQLTPAPPPAVPTGSLVPAKMGGSVTITYSYLLAPRVNTKLPPGSVVPKP